VLIAGVLVPPPAVGQTAVQGGEPESAEREQARMHFERGVALMTAEDWDAALAEFDRSLELSATRSALFNRGMCLKALHRYIEALRAFRQWREEYAGAAGTEERESVDSAVAQLQGFLGSLAISVSVAGATVLVDGQPVGTSPLPAPLPVEVGPHTVEATLEGCEPAREQVTITSGESRDVALVLTAVAPPATGPEESAGLDQVWFWTAAGTAAALGIAGAVTGGLTVARRDDFNEAATRWEEGDASAEADAHAIAGEFDSCRLATNVLLPAAGALAAAALVLAFFTDFGGESPEEPGVQVVAGPSLAPDGASPTGLSAILVVAF
jgi:hypothetical protein